MRAGWERVWSILTGDTAPAPQPVDPVAALQAARRAQHLTAEAIRNRPGSQVALHKLQALTTAELQAVTGRAE